MVDDESALALRQEGRRLLDAGLAADAIELLGRAFAGRPSDAGTARWLAEAQLVADDAHAARQTLDAALSAAPACSELIVLKAEAALKARALEEASAVLDAALDAAPSDVGMLTERARISLHAGEPAEGLLALERSLAIDPNQLEAQSLRIVLAGYDPAITTERLKVLQRAWPAPAPDESRFRSEDRAGRPLRVGYVSGGLWRHPAAKVAAAVLLNHDPAKVEVYCYSGSRKRDAVTLRLRMAVKGWRTLIGLDDAAAAAQIRADGIDILVDLDGHFPHNRLGVFARRAAPVQVSAWGYVAGPGTPGIDYLLTDAVVAPEAERALFPERIIHLVCAQPYLPELMPRPSAPPQERPPGPIRFGCFNRLDKLTDPTLALWGEILGACPQATLTLKDRFFGDDAVQRRVLARLIGAGARPAQLAFEPGEPHADYLAAFDRIDVALDPFPLSGGVTTLDGISQGVAAITLAGAAPTGRITASILAYAGLVDGICGTPQAYVRAAVGLAREPAGVADLRRRTLAARVHWGPDAMCRYAAEVEAAYVEMWDRHLAGGDAR